jgi:uncharacterized protein involved in exopolysaccharide biosynthesis
MPVDEVRKLINAIDDHRTEFNSLPFISKKLRKLVGISEPIDEKKSFDKLQHKLQQMNNELKQQMRDELKQTKDELKQMKDEFKQTKNELKQQMKDELKQTKDELIKDMQILLNRFIQNSNSNNDTKN